jgi:Methyltransferase domain
MSAGAPTEWDFTLLPFAGLARDLLDAAGANTVVEVGADRGDFTRELLDWAEGTGAAVTAIDPEPAPELIELTESRPELALVRATSPEALEGEPPADVYFLDGDHNHHTLSRELRAIAERSAGSGLPLLLLHDVGWPHARRDTYYAPERIPEGHRQPLARDALVAPGNPGLATSGIRFECAAAREGGERNGVLTAVEDFMSDREGLRLAVVPAFFGLGVLWSEASPWSAAVAEAIGPWDANPMLARLEEIRLAGIVDRTRLNRQEEELRALLGSGSFALAERLARLRGGGSAVSRQRVRRALEG